jgi:hypothetical protein
MLRRDLVRIDHKGLQLPAETLGSWVPSLRPPLALEDMLRRWHIMSHVKISRRPFAMGTVIFTHSCSRPLYYRLALVAQWHRNLSIRGYKAMLWLLSPCLTPL